MPQFPLLSSSEQSIANRPGSFAQLIPMGDARTQAGQAPASGTPATNSDDFKNLLKLLGINPKAASALSTSVTATGGSDSQQSVKGTVLEQTSEGSTKPGSLDSNTFLKIKLPTSRTDSIASTGSTTATTTDAFAAKDTAATRKTVRGDKSKPVNAPAEQANTIGHAGDDVASNSVALTDTDLAQVFVSNQKSDKRTLESDRTAPTGDSPPEAPTTAKKSTHQKSDDSAEQSALAGAVVVPVAILPNPTATPFPHQATLTTAGREEIPTTDVQTQSASTSLTKSTDKTASPHPSNGNPGQDTGAFSVSSVPGVSTDQKNQVAADQDLSVAGQNTSRPSATGAQSQTTQVAAATSPVVDSHVNSGTNEVEASNQSPQPSPFVDRPKSVAARPTTLGNLLSQGQNLQENAKSRLVPQPTLTQQAQTQQVQTTQAAVTSSAAVPSSGIDQQKSVESPSGSQTDTAATPPQIDGFTRVIARASSRRSLNQTDVASKTTPSPQHLEILKNLELARQSASDIHPFTDTAVKTTFKALPTHPSILPQGLGVMQGSQAVAAQWAGPNLGASLESLVGNPLNTPESNHAAVESVRSKSGLSGADNGQAILVPGTDSTLPPLADIVGTGASSLSGQTIDQLVASTASQASLVENGGHQHFEMRLDPPELGKITVEIHRSASGDVAVRVSAASPQTHALLNQQSSQISQALNHQGLSLSHFDLSQQQQHSGEEALQHREAFENSLLEKEARDQFPSTDFGRRTTLPRDRYSFRA